MALEICGGLFYHFFEKKIIKFLFDPSLQRSEAMIFINMEIASSLAMTIIIKFLKV